jgi:hypothetical protein
MKRYTKLLSFLLLGLCLVLNSCSEEEIDTEDNSLNIVTNLDIRQGSQLKSSTTYSNNNFLIINAIDASIQASINGVTDEGELNQIFMNYINEHEGLTYDSNEIDERMFSSSFNDFIEVIQNTNSYENYQDYVVELTNAQKNIEDSLTDEFEILRANELLDFQLDLVYYFNDLASQINNGDGQTVTNGWWSDWGRCAAGTLGGYLTGGAAGCALVGTLGAVIGAAATAPIGGLPGAVVGGIAGCAIGGTVGAIGGALTGAATFCDE